jgi:CRISPR system Cascade subunit CasC
VDADLLARNLGKKDQPNRGAAAEGVAAFAEAFIHAIPTGKQNSFAAHTPPSLVLAVVRQKGQPVSLANAFEKPARPNGERSLVEDAVARLGAHWQALRTMYGLDGEAAFALLDGAGDPGALGSDGAVRCESVPALLTWIQGRFASWRQNGAAS